MAANVVAPPPPAERTRRFVVLPFRNVTRAEAVEWLVEGSPTLLADALGHWQDVYVVPPSAMNLA